MDAGITCNGSKKEDGNRDHKSGKYSIDTKKNESKPWLKKMWCIGVITAEYRERMYRLLDLYEEDYDPNYPVVCMDEKSKQLLEDIRKPIPMKPGCPAKYDYEYKRNRTRNIFVANLVHQEYPKAIKVRLVLDNLNTHFSKSFYETFSKTEADQILEKVEFCYTPKHASWLNMAEIEINVMGKECLPDRIGSEERLKQQLEPWTTQRNAEKKKIQWTFTKKDADKNLSKHYVA